MAAYRNRTTFYKIPVMAFGDQMSEEQEMIQMGIIDSLLYASCFGCRKAIFEEGSYSTRESQGGSGFDLVITPVDLSSGYSLMGMVNGRMFYSHEPVIVGPLLADKTYYIYAEYANGLESSPLDFQLGFYESEQAESVEILPLCIVSTVSDPPVIDLDVDKPYAKNILAHILDTTNPHGRILHQQNLDVTNSLTVHGNPVHGAVYGSYTTQSGEYEWTPPAGKTPVFASAYPESASAGSVSWRISSGKVYFSSSGSTGVTVNFKVEIE